MKKMYLKTLVKLTWLLIASVFVFVSCKDDDEDDGPVITVLDGFYVTGEATALPELDSKGRMEVTKNEADKYMFKVPMLRNIAGTWPYFHDGSVTELDSTVRIMGKSQLNKDLTPEQVSDMVAFLKALNGELPESVKQAPAPL